jgi:hypothetical protein
MELFLENEFNFYNNFNLIITSLEKAVQVCSISKKKLKQKGCTRKYIPVEVNTEDIRSGDDDDDDDDH